MKLAFFCASCRQYLREKSTFFQFDNDDTDKYFLLLDQDEYGLENSGGGANDNFDFLQGRDSILQPLKLGCKSNECRMIQLFRKLRQQLLSEGKLKK